MYLMCPMCLMWLMWLMWLTWLMCQTCQTCRPGDSEGFSGVSVALVSKKMRTFA